MNNQTERPYQEVDFLIEHLGKDFEYLERLKIDHRVINAMRDFNEREKDEIEGVLLDFAHEVWKLSKEKENFPDVKDDILKLAGYVRYGKFPYK